MAQTALTTYLKAIYDSSERNKAKNIKESILFFPFLPSDNNLSSRSRGSFNFKERSSDTSKNTDDSNGPFSAIEVENYYEYTIDALRRLLSSPYLTFLR